MEEHKKLTNPHIKVHEILTSPIMPTFMDEREYSIENITKDKNKFNY